MFALEIYLLGALSLVLCFILLLQIITPKPHHPDASQVVLQHGEVKKITHVEFTRLINTHAAKLYQLRGYSSGINVEPAVTMVSRYIKEVYGSDALAELTDEDQQPSIFTLVEMLNVCVGKPAYLKHHAFNLDLLDVLLARLNERIVGEETYIGDNLTSHVKFAADPSVGVLPPLYKFDDSRELTHRLHKKSSDKRPQHIERSEEFEEIL